VNLTQEREKGDQSNFSFKFAGNSNKGDTWYGDES
jgi:hypothetical protein